MFLLDLFSSDERVEHALKVSVGHNISPNILPLPANDSQGQSKKAIEFKAPWLNGQKKA